MLLSYMECNRKFNYFLEKKFINLFNLLIQLTSLRNFNKNFAVVFSEYNLYRMEDLLLLYLFSKGFTLNSSELAILAIFSDLFSITVIPIFFLHSEHLGGSSTRTRQVSINGRTKLMIGRIIILNISVILLIPIGNSKKQFNHLFPIFQI